MPKTTPQQNKAIVLEAFDTLFNKRDYAAAERFWSPKYIQHSAHIAPGREGLFALVRATPDTLRYETNSLSQRATMSSRMAVSPGWEGQRLGLRPTLSDLKTVSWPNTGMYCRTKPHGKNPSAAFPCLAIAFLRKPRTFTHQSHHVDWRNHEPYW
jgi:hypothetical protein